MVPLVQTRRSALIVLLVAMAITALYGWTVERMAYRPLRGSFRLAPLISAIGMSIVLQNYIQNAQGADKKAFDTAFKAVDEDWVKDINKRGKPGTEVFKAFTEAMSASH